MANYFCNEDVDGVCNGCGNCDEDAECAGDCDACENKACYDNEVDVSWEQEWEDFGEEGCETIEYL